MLNYILTAATAITVVASAAPAQAEVLELDFDAAVRLVGEQTPEAAIHRAEVAVARSRIDGAGTWRHNPALSISAGPRFGDETSVDAMLGAKQTFAPGGRPAARKAVETARHRVAVLHESDEERRLAGRAARTFAELLYWQRQAEIAAGNLALAREIEAVAVRRNEVGDVGGLDPSVALLAVARAEADVAQVEAHRLTAEGELRWLLGIDDDTSVRATGQLRTIGRENNAPATPRTDVQLADARVDVERKRQHLATRDRVPRFTLGVVGGTEERAAVLRGVLEFTLPVFARGRPQLVEAIAEEDVRRAEATVVSARAQHELRAAQRRVAVLDEAVAQFADGGLEALKKTTQIATASYRAGAIPLQDLLVVRRELVAAEHDFSNLLLLAAMARIEVLESSGNLFKHPNKRMNR